MALQHKQSPLLLPLSPCQIRLQHPPAHLMQARQTASNTTMPRMLGALSSIPGDLSKHTSITTIGEAAQHICSDVMHAGSHLAHCALEQHMGGPDSLVD